MAILRLPGLASVRGVQHDAVLPADPAMPVVRKRNAVQGGIGPAVLGLPALATIGGEEDFPRIADDHGFLGREGLHIKKFIRQGNQAGIQRNFLNRVTAR